MRNEIKQAEQTNENLQMNTAYTRNGKSKTEFLRISYAKIIVIKYRAVDKQ